MNNDDYLDRLLQSMNPGLTNNNIVQETKTVIDKLDSLSKHIPYYNNKNVKQLSNDLRFDLNLYLSNKTDYLMKNLKSAISYLNKIKYLRLVLNSSTNLRYIIIYHNIPNTI